MIKTYDQEQIITTSVPRSLVGELLSLDFHDITDGFIGDFWGISRGLFLSILFVGLLAILWRQIPGLPLFAIEWVIGTSPIWIPIGAVICAWKMWVWYARAGFLARQKPVLLEVKFARDVVKSPRAMEVALSHIWSDSGETTYFNRIWQGQVRPIYSLEITSFGGEIHFYIWCWRQWRSTVEAAIYAQYPEVELYEVEDYASKWTFDPDEHVCFCTDWRLEPHNDAYQLKTYVDFELDADPKEEYKIDPLAQILERFSTLKPTEQIWIQFVITANKDQRPSKKTFFGSEPRWAGLLKDEIDAIRKQAAGDPDDPAQSWRRGARVNQFRQTEMVKSIDRNMGKWPYSVGGRGIYIADPASFGSPGYTAVRWMWRPVGNTQWGNQLRPRRWHNVFDYPWQDLWDIRWIRTTRQFLDCYRRRSHFYSPWILPYNMMSVEALATLWHPPSRAVATPGLERITAKKAPPPSNLPK